MKSTKWQNIFFLYGCTVYLSVRFNPRLKQFCKTNHFTCLRKYLHEVAPHHDQFSLHPMILYIKKRFFFWKTNLSCIQLVTYVWVCVEIWISFKGILSLRVLKHTDCFGLSGLYAIFAITDICKSFNKLS